MDYTRNLILAGDGGPHNAPRKLAEGFDANELIRRLLIVQAEQKAYANRKQKTRQDQAEQGGSVELPANLDGELSGAHRPTLASGFSPGRKIPNTWPALRPRGRFRLRFGLWPRSNT